MSVDLEDYYCDLPFPMWDKFSSRIVDITHFILELFEKYKIEATFFTLGYIAEKHPGLIEEVKSKGHEIASHGYSHTDLRNMTPKSFELDLTKSLEILSKISGEKILGFRAPFFSINKNNLWVFNIMKKYLSYDSSVFPVRTPVYGIPDALRYTYRVSESNPLEEDKSENFFELPLATLKMPLIGNIPIAGGFHMRFLPYVILKQGIKQLNKSGHSAMCYIHPKDLDPHMPHISEYGWHYYWGLGGATKKFESLLKNFRFHSARDILFS